MKASVLRRTTRASAATANFVYDADGKQVKAVVGSTTTYYVGAHSQVDNGVITKYYLAGATRIAMRKNGTLYYLLSDHLGSTSLTLNASGTKIAELRYKAWGETRYSSGTTYTAYQFTAQRNETSLGLYFYNARWYDPSLGRFTSADTLVPGGVQGLDRYAYVNNAPINYVDPTGHFTSKAIWNYLFEECDGNRQCANNLMNSWKNDHAWWNMITTAEAGDTLFGTSTCCWVGGGMSSTFTGTFTGSGNHLLIGVDGLPSSVSLIDVQNGVRTTGYSSDEKVTFGQTFKWIGFIRPDNQGTPSFYIRPGYKLEQSDTPAWQRIILQGSTDLLTSIMLAAIPEAGPYLAFGHPFLDASGYGTGELVVDMLDMQQGDVQVSITNWYGRGIYFNFQKFGDGWRLEKIRNK